MDVCFAYMHSMCLFACIIVTFSGVKLYSLDPRPKTNPSTNHFQYHGVILEVIHTLDEIWGQD